MDNNKAFKAELVASAITANCEAYFAGTVTRDAWSAEQDRLWKMAAKWTVAAPVMRIVCPSMGGK